MRLAVMRFPLIVGVLFIHSYELSVTTASGVAGLAQPGPVASSVRELVSMGIARIAVPAFFLMSGYLFFVGDRWSIESYRNKVKSRTVTLLVPFLFWNIFVLSIVAAAATLPHTHQFFSGSNKWISGFSVDECFDAVFGIGRNPIAYQFWFIRDLMVLVLLTPIIKGFIERIAPAYFAFLFGMWFFAAWPDGMVPGGDALLFFSMGCWLAVKNKNIFFFDFCWTTIALFYCGFLLLDVATAEQQMNPYIHRAGLILGVIATFGATKFVAESPAISSALMRLANPSFFVFAAQEPLLTAARKVLYTVEKPTTDAEVLILYFVIPMTVIAALLLVYYLMSHSMPRVLGAITGLRRNQQRVGLPLSSSTR